MGGVRKLDKIAYQRSKDKDSQRLDSKESLKDSIYGSLSLSLSLVDDDSKRNQLRERAIAERILRKLGDTKSWKFYLKCAYKLSEQRINDLLEYATRPEVKDPNRYFVSSASREMK